MLYRLLWLPCLLVAVLSCAPVAMAHHAAQLERTTTRAESVRALLARAQAAFDKGDYQTAKELFTRATVLAPRNAVAWAGKARSENWLNDNTDAVSDYTVAIRYAPTNALYYLRRGISYGDLGDSTHALADYSMSIRLDPHNFLAYYNRAALYYNQGENAQSIADYTQAIRLRPTLWQAFYYRGEGELNLRLDPAAVDDFTAYIQHTPRADCACAYTERGDAYYDMAEYKEALADYQQAIAIGPAGSGEYSNYGAAAYFLHKYAVTISAMTTAIGLDPTDARGFYYRGLAKRDTGDKAGAIADLKEAVQLFTQQGNAAWAQQAATALSQIQVAS